ncbi:response regulator transcription factor [Glutamicibacter creatinolyticus]|uniref:helix-turn-helix transcriptional regulator n=1 Tax=Glutamicibacter creatinolyticus TaxID=162496 RepID=UPI0037C1A17A
MIATAGGQSVTDIDIGGSVNSLGRVNAGAGGTSKAGYQVLNADEVATLERDLISVLLDQRIRTILVAGPPSAVKSQSINGAIDGAGLRDCTFPIVGTRYASRLAYGAVQYLLSEMPRDMELTHSSVYTELYRVLSEAHEPRLFVLEDAAHLDRATLAVITQLATAAKVRLLIVDEHLAALPVELSSLYASTASAGIEVPKLNRAQIRGFIANMTGYQLSSLLTVELQQASKGSCGLLLTILEFNLECGRIRVIEEFLVRGEQRLIMPDHAASDSHQKLRVLSMSERNLLSELASKGATNVSDLTDDEIASLDTLIASGTALIDPDIPRARASNPGLPMNGETGHPTDAAFSLDPDTRNFLATPVNWSAIQWVAEATEILHQYGPNQALACLERSGFELDSLTSAPIDDRSKLELVGLACSALAGAGKSSEADVYMEWLVNAWWEPRNALGGTLEAATSEQFFTNMVMASFLLGRWNQARCIVREVRERLGAESYAFVQGIDAVLGILAGETDDSLVNELRANALQSKHAELTHFLNAFAFLGSASLQNSQWYEGAENATRLDAPTTNPAVMWWTQFALVLGSQPQKNTYERFLSLASLAEVQGNHVARLYAVACAVRSGGFESQELLRDLAQETPTPVAQGFSLIAEALSPTNSSEIVEGLRRVSQCGFAYYAHPRGSELLSNLSGASKQAAQRFISTSHGSESFSEAGSPTVTGYRHLLTKGELRTAVAAASGLTNSAIAKKECVSVRTVEGRLYQTYSKLNVSNRRELSQLFESMRREPTYQNG